MGELHLFKKAASTQGMLDFLKKGTLVELEGAQLL
jgi:hypothetical protein